MFTGAVASVPWETCASVLSSDAPGKICTLADLEEYDDEEMDADEEDIENFPSGSGIELSSANTPSLSALASSPAQGPSISDSSPLEA